jgi:hypothetical protein
MINLNCDKICRIYLNEHDSVMMESYPFYRITDSGIVSFGGIPDD